MSHFLPLLSLAAVAVIPASALAESNLRSADEPEAGVLRILCYNIRHGRGMDGNVDLERIAEVIRTQKPHLVALQEVDKGVRRTDGRDIPAELSQLTGMEAYFEMNFPFQGGEYGNAILSRLPILSKRNTHYRMLREDEQRGVIQVLVQFEGQGVLFMNTHIDHRPDDAERMQNLEQIEEVVAEFPGVPVIIAGDFNDFPGSRVHSRMKQTYLDAWEEVGEGDGFTYRSDKPDRRIDYIWLQKESGLKPLRTWIVETLASDHLPLLLDVEVKPQEKRD